MLGLRELGLDVRRGDSTKVSFSVKDLAKHLMDLQILSYPNTGSYSRQSHYQCNFQDNFRDLIKRVLDDLPLTLLDSHKRHLRAQHLKCN
jgi:hypothetical protein